MAVTVKSARRQLAEDLGDYFVSTTTSDGAASGDTLVDDALKEQNDDRFITKQTSVWIEGGQSNGPTSDQERGLADGTKVSDTITPTRNFDVTGATGSVIKSGIEYEVHRSFSAAAKNRAITQALRLCFPIVFKRASGDVLMAADQYDYNISTIGLYRNEPRQVHLVNADDTELTREVFAWEVRDGTNLHLLFRPTDGEKLRVFGIQQPAITDLDATASLLIVSARAAWYLYEQAINSVPTDQVGRYKGLLEQAQRMFQERVIRFQEIGLPATLRTDVFDQSTTDIRWSTP
jgi:hypothetical protein